MNLVTRVHGLANRNWRKCFSTHGAAADLRQGLVLGVYASGEKSKNIRLSQAAEEFNQSTQGKLLEHINLSVH